MQKEVFFLVIVILPGRNLEIIFNNLVTLTITILLFLQFGQ